METDRELLELAAEAAGYTIAGRSDLPDHECDLIYHAGAQPVKNRRDLPLGAFCWGGEEDSPWSPLIDDGDRYRLLSKLKGRIDFANRCVSIGAVCICWPDDESTEARATVRAAAEIVKKLRQSVNGN